MAGWENQSLPNSLTGITRITKMEVTKSIDRAPPHLPMDGGEPVEYVGWKVPPSSLSCLDETT